MKKLLKKKRESLNQIMRDEICSTALQIIMESGFSRLTMDRLATRLGIAKGTLYYYFKNKDSLVLETANMISAPLFSALREINEQQISSKNKLLSAAKILSKHFYMYKDFHFTLHEHYGYKFFEQESVIEEREQTRKCIRKIIEDGINKKEFNNISIEAATENFIGIVMHSNFNRTIAVSEKKGVEDKEIEEILELFLYGIKDR